MSPILQRLLLAAFVIVDVVLVVGAVRHVNGTPPSTDLPDVSATAGAAPTPAPPDASATTAAPAQLPYDFAASDATTMSAANDGTIIYGTRGNCGGPEATVQVSTDGGTSFVAASTGLTTTLAVRAGNATSIAVVGTNANCDVQQLSSSNGGRTWTESADVQLWYPAADDTATVVTPAGASQPREGCIVTSVSQVTAESGRVSCADGSILGSGDNGETWVGLGRLDNLRVSTFLTPTAGYALARFSGCAANAFTTDNGGVTWTPGGCITGEPARAIAATSSSLFAVVDEEAYNSTDDGASWMQP